MPLGFYGVSKLKQQYNHKDIFGTLLQKFFIFFLNASALYLNQNLKGEAHPKKSTLVIVSSPGADGKSGGVP